MIQFACPSCAAVFSVGDEKAGKTGKCPKCDAKFVIPDAEPGAAPPPSPADDTIEIKPCPGCQAKLTVARGDIGLDVECPYCKTVYKATKSGGSSAVIRTDRPSKRSAKVEDEDEDDRPRRRSRRDEDDEDDDRSSKRRSRYDDDDDERPRRKRRTVSRSSDNRTAGLLSLITGIISIIPGCCCVFLGVPLGVTAIISGIIGLKSSARGMSIAGIVMGSVCIVWMIIAIVLGATGALDDFKAANPRNNPFQQRGR